MRVSRRVDALRWWAAVLRRRLPAYWFLRRARRVGPWPAIFGRPTVEATDLEVGAAFKVVSQHRSTLISGWGPIRVGDRVFVNSGVILFSVVGVTIGDDVALANEVYLTDTNSHGVEGGPVFEAPVRIGAGSWIGARAIILPGVTVGRRVVVAAGSVVARDVGDDVLVAGNPASVVRTLSYPPGCRRAWHDPLCACPAAPGACPAAPGACPAAPGSPAEAAQANAYGCSAAS